MGINTRKPQIIKNAIGKNKDTYDEQDKQTL